MRYPIFAFFIAMVFSASAFATSYACITSREVPQVAFEYNDGGEGPGETDEVSRWETKDRSGNAFALIKAMNDPEFGVDKKKINTTHTYKGKQILGAPLSVIIKKEGSNDSLLEVPYIDPGHQMDTSITSRNLIFDGKKVKSVDYRMCGQD